MRIFIVKTEKTLKVYKETTTQSILSDLLSGIVMVILIGLDILFSKTVGRSLVIDVLVCCLLIMYLLGFAKKKEQVLDKEELKKIIDEL